MAGELARALDQIHAIFGPRQRQSDYVAAWRAKHPDVIHASPWVCPLCGWSAAPLAHEPFSLEARWHQDDHGQDYLDYLAAGQVAEGGEGGS